jgi:hypothetical protein
MCRYSEAV